MKRTDNPNRGKRKASRFATPKVVHRASPCVCTLADGTTYVLASKRTSAGSRKSATVNVAQGKVSDLVKYAGIIGNLGDTGDVG